MSTPTQPRSTLARPPSVTGTGRVLFGGDYNPEQWPEEVWLEDARLMREAGVNLVSVGIFAWARLEPSPDKFDFGWLDRCLGLLHAHGISANLATPTASPPPWLIRAYPDALPITANGARLWHGSRRHYCPHSPALVERAERIVRALAERYRDHPALALWHVDNELACHVTECFCERSGSAFRTWLRKRYGDIGTLNDAWGSAFWGQVYGTWEEVEPPRTAPTFINSGHVLDWRRFWSDSWIDWFRGQKAMLREVSPGVPVTTNFMNFHGPIDYWALAAEEDVVANDAYPDPSKADWMVDAAMGADLIRSLARGEPWMLMEQASGHVNWRATNATKRPGVMRLGSYQAVARGANAVMFFQWRASRAGAEKYHSAMLPHGGESTRTWREIRALGNELATMDAVTTGRTTAEVAILYDWPNTWAFGLEGKPTNEIELLAEVRAFYEQLFRANVTVDFAQPTDDLDRYRLVIAPHLYLIEDAAIANLTRYVERGGVLLVTYLSGLVDGNDRVLPGAHPGGLRDLLGITVEEFSPLPDGAVNTVVIDDGRRYAATRWCDLIDADRAYPIATFRDDFFAGRPAVTVNRLGDGQTIYVGTRLESAGLGWLVATACDRAGVVGQDSGADGQLEIVERVAGGDRWRFVLNHGSTTARLPIEAPAVDLLTGRRWVGSVDVGPVDLVVLGPPAGGATGTHQTAS